MDFHVPADHRQKAKLSLSVTNANLGPILASSFTQRIQALFLKEQGTVNVKIHVHFNPIIIPVGDCEAERNGSLSFIES